MNYFNKIKTYISSHKTVSIIALIIILFIGYWGYGKITSGSGETRYVMTTAGKGTIISLISGSGQVSALNQIGLTPKSGVSGTIMSVNVAPGDQIKQGQTLFTIDTTNAEKTVRDAEINLQNANLALQKLQLQNSSTSLNTTLSNDYVNGFNAVSDTFLDLLSTLTGINNMLAQNNLSDNAARNSGNTGINYRNTAETAYYSAETAYEKNKGDFSVIDYNSKQSDIDAVISETYKTTELLANAIKDLNDYTNFLSQNTGRTSDYASYQTTISGYTSTINGHLSALLSAQTNISNDKNAFPSSDLNMQTTELTVKQSQNSLSDAEQNLSDYYIRAPFDGVVASIPVQKGDTAGSGTTLGTLITTKQVAIISLNEVDVAKIALGEKVTVTFDAIPDLTIAGQVVQIDSVGTVSSGVVNYNVKISFDTTDARIKPGMSVNTDIITNIKQDVLTVPNSAVKTQNGTSYVQMFSTALPAPIAGVQGSPSATPPINQIVEIGISDDANTEIISGLKEGDQVVTKTVTGSTASITTKTTSTKSILGGIGGGPRD